MLYLSKMLRVLWPESVIAMRSGIPARTILRTAVRRRSCTRTGLRPAASQALDHALRKSPIGSPLRWNTSELSSQRLACARSMISRSSTRKRKHATVFILADFRSQTNDSASEIHVAPPERLHFTQPPPGQVQRSHRISQILLQIVA